MLLSDHTANKELPREYEWVMNDKVINTFVFSEKDLPGFASRNQKAEAVYDKSGRKMPPIPGRFAAEMREKAAGGKDKGAAQREPGKRWVPYLRKAIPSAFAR
jgi:transcription initiation factor TFIIF subunit beta